MAWWHKASYTVASNNPFWANCDFCGNKFKIDHWEEHKQVCDFVHVPLVEL